MYIKRTSEKLINELSKMFSVLIITGPRQVGKSTMLLLMKPKNMNYVSLDDLEQRKLAISDPKYFLEIHGTPLIIDEIQYAPNLLPYIKMKVDETKYKELIDGESSKCLYWITGSQKFNIMKDVSESLAGRAAILELNSLSFEELNNNDFGLFKPNIENIKNKKITKHFSIKEIFEVIFKGGMPSIIANNLDKDLYFSSYVNTYNERDLKELVNVSKTTDFYNFMQYLAVRTSQELNYSSIAKEIGVDSKTIKSWISTLETSGIIYLLHPYHRNMSNRIIKSPKVYFMDTGLCSYLAKYSSPEILEAGALSGAIFETFVVSEIIKSFYNNGMDPKRDLYFYRDKDQKEVDLLYVDGEKIYPIEIKKGISPNHPDKNFSVLKKFNLEIGHGLVICMIEKITPINKNCTLIPVEYI